MRPMVEVSTFSLPFMATTVSPYTTTEELNPPPASWKRHSGSPVRASMPTTLPHPVVA